MTAPAPFSPCEQTKRLHATTCNNPTVCLITPLSLVDFVDPDMTIKSSRYIMAGNIGILTLAARLTNNGYTVRIVNLDQLFLQFLDEDNCGSGKIECERANKPPERDSNPESFLRIHG